MADDDFNSSELDFSGEDDTSAPVGKKAIASILEKSVTDRVQSKKTVKTLKPVGNAPGTTWHRRYWLQLFNAFASATLGMDKRKDKTPVEEDVVRFISCLPGYLQSRHDDGKIGFSVIKNAELQLDRALTFEYPNWSITRRGGYRIDAAIQGLLDKGEITKDPVREKQWITYEVVHKLATAVLSDAVQTGTKNWDLTLAGTFSFVFQAALAARSGDIMKSVGYKGDEYLKWQDIELRATGSGDEMVFKMKVKLLYRKGYKRDNTNAFTVELGSLPDDSSSAIDPVKLCIAYALRVGAVKETSWLELFNAVQARPNKRVLWAKPTSPVFCAITRSNQLDMSKPAIVQQNQRFLTRAAGLIGMLNAPITHDIRRGAASDVYALKSTGSGDLNRTRRTVGHAHKSTSKGITDAYIGHEKADSWAERVAQAPDDTGEEGPVELGTAPFKKRRVQKKDIDTYCDSNQLDKKLTKDRQKAGLALQKLQREQHASYQRDILNGVQTPALLPPQVSGSRARAPLQDLTNVSRKTSEAGALTRKRKQTGPDEDEDIDEDGDRLAQDNIDPALRTFASDVLGVQIGARVDSMGAQASSSVDSMVEGCISLLAASPSPAGDELAFLTAPRNQFIGFLSTVNLVRVSTRRTLEVDAAGNSRDPPSLFLLYCRKEHCSRSFVTETERDAHEVNCRPASARPAPVAFNGVQSDADEPPPVPATKKRTYTKLKPGDALKPGFPKVCPESDTCGVTKPFNTRHTLAQHKANYHDTTWPQNTPCNFPGCTLPRTSYFTSRNQFRRHLNRHHYQDKPQAQRYIDLIMPPSQDDPEDD